MASNETLKQLNVEVNDSHASDVKENLKQFLDTHETIVETKKQLVPLFTEVVTSEATAEKIETTVNKEHITNLLVAMKNEFAADWSNYREVYNKRWKAITFWLQSALRIMWYKIWDDEIDGRYWPDTTKAVMQFQQINGLSSVDGAAWVETFTALANANLDAPKITEEQSNIVPVKKAKDKPSKGDEAFYTTHTDFVEQEFGWVKNKVYTVLNYTDVPDSIATNTVINLGTLRFFSNGKVYEYDKDGNITRRWDKSELDLEGKWKVATLEPAKEPAKVVVPDSKVDTISTSDMTFDQLQVNLDSIWSKYFTFDQQWQKDFITEKHLDKGISVEGHQNGISIRSKWTSYYYLSIDQSKYITSDGKINTKEVISLVKKDIVEQMENEHYRAMLEDKIDSKYATWDQIFTKEELADTTSEQGKKIQEFITSFSKNWATVDIIKKSWQYMINRTDSKPYFNYTFKTKSKEKWNENNNVVSIWNIVDEKWEFNQKKWNSEVRNMIFQKKLTHPYFTKYEKVDI